LATGAPKSANEILMKINKKKFLDYFSLTYQLSRLIEDYMKSWLNKG